MWNLTGKPLGKYEVDIDKIFDEAGGTMDKDKRFALFKKWQSIASCNLPLIYTAIPYNIFAIRNKFGNVYPTSFEGAFHDIDRIYIKDGK